MRRISLWEAGVCLLLLLGIAGCTAEDQAPGYMETHRMTGLDAPMDRSGSLLSPVMQDVYDRSIPEEVYSAE
ncbi:hypothetical protein [Paenibacillus sp. BAC0078]